MRRQRGRRTGRGRKQERGKHNPMESLLISNGNIWKCTLPLAKHTLDRGQATSEERQNGGENVSVCKCVREENRVVSVDCVQPDCRVCATLILNSNNLFLFVFVGGKQGGSFIVF